MILTIYLLKLITEKFSGHNKAKEDKFKIKFEKKEFSTV